MYIITEVCDRECSGHYFENTRNAATDKANELLKKHCATIGREEEFEAYARKQAPGTWPPDMQLADPVDGEPGAWCNLDHLRWDAHVNYIADQELLDALFRRSSVEPVPRGTPMLEDAPDAKDIVQVMAARQRMNDGHAQICPRCGCPTIKPQLHSNATSRHAPIYICDQCGGHEAVLDAEKQRWPFKAWAVSDPDFRVEIEPKTDD